MQDINIVKKINFNDKSFRVKSILNKYGITNNEIVETFNGTININDDYNIGLIVGRSGSGKSTIIKELYHDYIFTPSYSNKAIIEDMPINNNVDQICKVFNSVGFSSIPSYLKPYNVLSNGEKMRVDLAYAILSDIQLIVFDEFTSVVDRQIAKIGSYAIQKCIRKNNKKFIAVTCHYDVEEWLMPDWVFDTNEMCMKYNKRRFHRHPELRFNIFSTKEKNKYWNIFRKFHYLNHNLNTSADVYLLECNNEIIAFESVLHQPNHTISNLKREHRLVVLPDWQGLSIGHLFSSQIAKIYTQKKYRFTSITSNPALCNSRNKSNNWKLIHQGRKSQVSSSGIIKSSRDRYTMSWEYIN